MHHTVVWTVRWIYKNMNTEGDFNQIVNLLLSTHYIFVGNKIMSSFPFPSILVKTQRIIYWNRKIASFVENHDHLRISPTKKYYVYQQVNESYNSFALAVDDYSEVSWCIAKPPSKLSHGWEKIAPAFWRTEAETKWRISCIQNVIMQFMRRGICGFDQ